MCFTVAYMPVVGGHMLGCYTHSGFMSYVPWLRRYMLFASDSDYRDYVEAHEEPD